MSRQKYDTFENEGSSSNPATIETSTISTVTAGNVDVRDAQLPMEEYKSPSACEMRFQLLVGIAQIAFEVISTILDWVVYGTVSSNDTPSTVNAFLAFSIIGMIILILQILYVVIFYRWGIDIRVDIMSVISIVFKILPQVSIIFFIEVVYETDHYNPSQIIKIVHALADVTIRIIIFVVFLYRQYRVYEKAALQTHSTIVPMFVMHIVFTVLIVTLSIIVFSKN